MPAKMPAMMMVVMLLIAVGALFFLIQGVNMHSQVAIEEQQFHQLQEGYWLMSKADRDGAATGSELNQRLVQIMNTPSELLRLKLVGVGKILTGIFVVLLGIMLALVMMPMRLGMIMKQQMQNKQ